MNCSTCPDFNQSLSHPACNAHEVMIGTDANWNLIRCKECVESDGQQPKEEQK